MNVLQGIDSMRWRFSLLFLFIVFLAAEISLSSGAKNRQESEDGSGGKSGRQQTREEYFADIEDGSLRYFTIGIDTPVVETKGDSASITFTSVLDASAYGAKGVYRMSGTHRFEKRDGKWYAVNSPDR